MLEVCKMVIVRMEGVQEPSVSFCRVMQLKMTQ